MTKSRALTAAFVVLLLAILGSAYGNDLASCHRSQVTRRSLLGQEQFAQDASAVRGAASRLEVKSNPARSRLDAEASVRYLAASKRIHVDQLGCTGLVP
jgi:hypothetical protein